VPGHPGTAVATEEKSYFRFFWTHRPRTHRWFRLQQARLPQQVVPPWQTLPMPFGSQQVTLPFLAHDRPHEVPFGQQTGSYLAFPGKLHSSPSGQQRSPHAAARQRQEHVSKSNT